MCNEFLFVGYSVEKEFERYQVARTNHLAIDFLRNIFPNKKVIGFELNKSDIGLNHIGANLVSIRKVLTNY